MTNSQDFLLNLIVQNIPALQPSTFTLFKPRSHYSQDWDYGEISLRFWQHCVALSVRFQCRFENFKMYFNYFLCEWSEFNLSFFAMFAILMRILR